MAEEWQKTPQVRSGVELDDGSLRDAMRYPRTFMLMLVSRQITEQSWLSQV